MRCRGWTETQEQTPEEVSRADAQCRYRARAVPKEIRVVSFSDDNETGFLLKITL